MMSRSVCLAGMMGAGKSTVARMLGERLGRRVVDTDDEIRRWTGRDIDELFAVHGEDAFRELEHRVVAEVATLHDLVVSLGGGAVLRDDNVEALRLTGVIVYLDVAVDVLVERLAADETARPLLTGKDLRTTVRELHHLRDPRYRQVANLTVDAGRDAADVADEIIAWMLSQGDVLTPSEHEQVMP